MGWDGVRVWGVGKGDRGWMWRGGHLTSSPSVDQKECEIRVTTRPGDEGVPRWSSLVWTV